MDVVEAGEAVRLVQSRAVVDAAAALREAESRVGEWGVEKARQLVKRSAGPGQDGRSTFRVNLASRYLREWYLRVYRDTTAEAFGRTSQPVTPSDVERTAAEASRLNPNAPPQAALKVAAVLWRQAREDAWTQTAAAYVDFQRLATSRAVVRGTVGGSIDATSAAVLQAWYRRSFDDAVDFTAREQPLRAVTAQEAELVAQAVTTGQIRRIVGSDGIVVVTQNATMTSDVDRRLAAGEVGVVEPQTPIRSHATLEAQVRQGWNNKGLSGRKLLIGRAGAEGVDPHTTWAQLPWPVATTYIRHWLDTHRSLADADQPTLEAAHQYELCAPIPGPPASAAALMFNLPTAPTAAPAEHVGVQMRNLMAGITSSSRQPRGADDNSSRPDLRSQVSSDPAEDPLRDLAEHLRASFPMPATEAIRQWPGPQDKPPAQKPRDPDRGIEL